MDRLLIIDDIIEVIDLSDDSTKCPNITHPPEMDIGDKFGVYMNNQLIVCYNKPYSYKTACFSTKSIQEEWAAVGQTIGLRHFPTTVQISDTEWWITGGLYSINSTEIFTGLPQNTKCNKSHCP
jgi:hypothetical protein